MNSQEIKNWAKGLDTDLKSIVNAETIWEKAILLERLLEAYKNNQIDARMIESVMEMENIERL